MEFFISPGDCCLPGDIVATIQEDQYPTNNAASASGTVIRTGQGILQHNTWFVATKPGWLRHNIDKANHAIWIEKNQFRYVPMLEDRVIAIVVDKHTEGYRVDIGAADTAFLPFLAFEGATKRNRPYLDLDSLVYCRVVRADKDMEVEVSCIEPGSNKSWVTGETFYGPLSAGSTASGAVPAQKQPGSPSVSSIQGVSTLIRVSLVYAKLLLLFGNAAKINKQHAPTMTAAKPHPQKQIQAPKTVFDLGNHVPFECAVGLNGRIWIKTSSVRNTVFISTAIKNTDGMNEQDFQEYLANLIKHVGTTSS